MVRREVESLPALEALLASGKPLTGVRLQDLDLTGHEAQLLGRTDLTGLVVLGGRLSPELDAHLRAHRALVFPTDPHAPVDPYRATLYSPAELYAGLSEHGYDATPDSRAYRWARDGSRHHDAFATLLRAIHDDSISDALDEFVDCRPLVGVMGGHALDRGRTAYAEAALAGHRLARLGVIVATGGGPGAMEAANLGAFADDEQALESALRRLAAVPSFRPDIGAWASLALEVRQELRTDVRADDTGARSLGIPTWFYGHEPPNVFCDGIGKYFSNAIREDGLLSRATAGVVVLEGAAGTVQEVFQALTPSYYAADDETLALPPVVLVGQEYWTDTVPIWAAVRALGQGRALGDALHLVDTVDEAVAVIASSPGREAVR
ncbi:Rossmann fold nucleotide-binding protein [Phycicoccus sp. Root563]|uniref:LOG family protein n=1 Tax=unclassified Phycicoccus TaxID=2637926 RepID=UPI000702A452|nr:MULTISPECIES: LOG family protein [unclassified Phycicoccus]KQU70563.1 Rossmann fold nucleotide-binding protein [Phycicoccus sp. Root101]KQZ88856.1 Rossmann fold nucleotide-binding protein [Phycicoccus sp. Root563]